MDLARAPLLLLACLPQAAPTPAAESIERRLSAMGTWLVVAVEGDTRADALAASEAAVRALEAVEARLSTWREESELSRLNRAPVGEPFPLSPELESDLLQARAWHELTDGAFEPGIGALVRAWDLRGAGRRPSPAELERALSGANLQHLVLEPGCARRGHPGLVIEEGGFGKGLGLDAALAALRDAGARSARVDLGGQVAVIGSEPTEVLLADPRDRGVEALAVVLQPGTSIATSGNSERGLGAGGERIGHLLDPRSGQPAEDFGSLSVVADSAALADALSTALFVMGPERALAWAEARPGIDCLVLAEDDGSLVARATSGLAGRVEPLTRVRLLEAGARPASCAGQEQEAPVQEHAEERLLELERSNDELRRTVEGLGLEVERLQHGRAPAPAPAADASASGARGLGPSASKVYREAQGASIGGYGEFLYQDPHGAAPRSDAQRVVTYIGYKFDEHFLFNSEIEVEHASTGEDGEVALEFGYVDWLPRDDLGLRAGLLLVPLGWVNELHEPTSFLAAERSQTERRIIPTTWRENGLGLHGESGDFDWRAYLLTGLEGEGFDASGLRGGRQKGSQAVADDLAAALRLDWNGRPGFVLGGSFYHGDSGQGDAALPDLSTTIVDLHLQLESGPWFLRGLAARADVDDAGAFDAATGEALAETLEGWYAELGCDLFAACNTLEGQSLTPFVRFESIDTQASMPASVARDPRQASDIVTFGLSWKPIDRVVLKVDYQEWRNDADRFDLLVGYAF